MIFRNQFRVGRNRPSGKSANLLTGRSVVRTRLPLSRLGQPGSIPAFVQPSGGMAVRHRKGKEIELALIADLTPILGQCDHEAIRTKSSVARCLSVQSANLLIGRSMVRTRPPHLDYFCLDLSNSAASQSSCFLRVAWQLGSGRVLQQNDYIIIITIIIIIIIVIIISLLLACRGGALESMQSSFFDFR
ncbi:hypothetical protein CSKR_103397 [Clonorchis sinensis]|uniref:Uncharacterized protein n=1 Tax=Clonorchis sinensis TaxID=79923 RepID=A0A419PGR9_CLOSI|nr:hypothetical protein CSKR_103397 [Clonorchis sinensis]